MRLLFFPKQDVGGLSVRNAVNYCLERFPERGYIQKLCKASNYA